MSQSELTQIGKYQIVGQVGEGAMGVVYRALDPVLSRPVAIKVMSDAVARNDELRGRFLREAQAAGSLQHPNVITIYDFGEVDGHLYIAMEFVEGEDLEDLLAKHVTLSLVDKLDVIVDVLGGLAYAHKRGIVHRDIKPANIRIDEEGRARIMDFGIAHLTSSNMTRTGVMVGTPAYMAPEQIVGSGITPATDLFSVGAVLYELLTGSKPFEGESLQNVMYKIVSQPSPSLPTGMGLPPALDGIVQHALAKDVKDRYNSALEMANALTEVRAGLDRAALASKTVSLRSVIDTALAGERAGKLRRARRRKLTTIASAVGVLAAASVVGVLMFRQNPRTIPPIKSAAARLAADTQTAAPSASIPTAPSTVNAPASPKTTQVAQSPKQQAVPKPPKTEPPSDALVLVRTLQTTAAESRRRAVDAGATTEQLRSGDDANRSAETLIGRGKLSDAAAKLNEATSAWSVAERDARVATSAAATRTRVTASEPVKAEIPPAPATVAPTAPQATPVKLPTANAATEIESAVAAYGHAIESRDIAEVRRAYPGITPTQASGFEQFFASVRTLRATFALSSLDVAGATAEGKLTGSYDYLTREGKNERQAVSFQAAFRRDATGWKLASVR
jgi:serine/threonine protein kinase